MPMITVMFVVLQEQLIASSEPGKVVVVIDSPRVLSIQPDGAPQARPAGTDGAYEQAVVLENGNLLYQPLGPGTPGYAILGANLKPLS